MPARVITVCFATICWTVALVSSALAGQDLPGIVTWGFGAMLIGGLVGTLVGRFMQWVVDDALVEHKKAHPIPEDDPMAAEGGGDELVV